MLGRSFNKQVIQLSGELLVFLTLHEKFSSKSTSVDFMAGNDARLARGSISAGKDLLGFNTTDIFLLLNSPLAPVSELTN